MGKPCRNCRGTFKGRFACTSGEVGWQTKPILCTSALPTVKPKTEIVATHPAACSQEWDKSSQLLHKKHFSFQSLCLLSSLKGSKPYKWWDAPLLSWTYCSGHPVLPSSDTDLPSGPQIGQLGTPSSKRVAKMMCAFQKLHLLLQSNWWRIFLTARLDAFSGVPSP